MDNRLGWIGWQILLPGSGRRVWDIIHHFGSPVEAWQASENDLQGVPCVGVQGARKLVQRRKNIQFDNLEKYLEKISCKVLTIDDETYPYLLKCIHDPPPAIFVRGHLPQDDCIGIAIIGSRKPSPYGLVVTETLAGELARGGIEIISGMARGIDSASHRAALMNNGMTMAVLGCGPDIVYPRENEKLMKQIIEKGAIITEFPPGTMPEPWHFPSRNRIISGLSSAVVVIEAAEKSGALITADFALEQGREVMAVPGNINNPKSAGTNKLIKQGASLVTGALDILKELGIETKDIKSQQKKSKKVTLEVNEKKVLAVLSEIPQTMEQVINLSKLLPEEVAAALTILEIEGLIRSLPGKMYINAGL
ncbi:DNA protecting protein DprA [Desulforamulus reducens MI-1]|uniref:DNA protecting protein DprA n=1 Tax=Desulforamulus reducens (strain ATCC BAA-1160 / DSM 100696 / MI-1) TaxID=349161 RepID=A4J600_DESRM|nr:DNA protecting protein DprA [Desulforamulus reducens MI-1]